MDLSNLPALGSGSTILVALIYIGFGLLNCFFGYRLFRILLAVYGFVLGALAGVIVASSLAAGQTLWLIVGAIAGGIIGAVLMIVLFFVGVFVIGALAGALLASAIGTVIGVHMPTVVVIIVAIVVGIIALIAQRVVLILATAFGGAWAAVAGGVMLFTGQSLAGLGIVAGPVTWEGARAGMLVVLIVWLVLGIAGTVVQFRITREVEPAAPARRRFEGPRDAW
jgi:hypothetical protein